MQPIRSDSIIPLQRRALTIAEFAQSYRLSRSKTYEMIASGELLSVKRGGRRLIPVDAAEAWLQGVEAA